eukprot:COSAG02_NODE_1481_length_12389_cov_15.643857_7_plen_54_part_00
MLYLAALGLLLGGVAGSEVVDLTDESFEGFITEHETTMVSKLRDGTPQAAVLS